MMSSLILKATEINRQCSFKTANTHSPDKCWWSTSRWMYQYARQIKSCMIVGKKSRFKMARIVYLHDSSHWAESCNSSWWNPKHCSLASIVSIHWNIDPTQLKVQDGILLYLKVTRNIIKIWQSKNVYIFSIEAKKSRTKWIYMSIENLKVTKIFKRKIMDHLSFL